ncbi:flavodoxin [Niallia sp.]|uniref:flavodoxin n=1 Tax=Niallia sp. TaxID=2837523 RepID=UPI0028A0FD29|nr:flavodoxin [Niallia sp.]
MKNILNPILIFSIVLLLGACSLKLDEPQEEVSKNNNSTISSNSVNKENGTYTPVERDVNRTLIVYFSMPETAGTDALAGASRVVTDGEVLGNTQQIAYWIEEEIGANIFQITTVDEYPGDHDELVAQGEAENESNFRPEILSHIENLDDYDTILFGYPVWVYDLPSVIYSFLDDTDFSGKTIIPFSTHGGSQFTNTRETIVELEPDAIVEVDNGLTISRNDVPESQQEVLDWLSEIGY